MRLTRPWPIRARLTLWQVGAFSLIFGALVSVLVLTERSTLLNNAQESLELTARVVVDQISNKDVPLDTILARRVIPGEVGSPEVIGQIVRGADRVIESSGGSTVLRVADAEAIRQANSVGHWHGRLALPGRSSDDMVVAVRVDQGVHAGDVLLLAQTLTVVQDAVRRSELLALAAAPLAIGLASLGGWLVAGAALRPVDELTRRAARVDAAAPHEPLPVPPAQDEISRLAVTLNAMLARLTRALETERRLAADASHELRTPISVMEAELDVALRSPQLPPEAVPALASVKAEASALGRIVGNLLLLSRAEATGEVALEMVEDDLLDLAYAVTARLQGRAHELGVTLDVEGSPTAVHADPDLLRQAIANLVDNALVQTPRGGAVRVLVADRGEPRISVVDTGVGITEADQAHIFDRFYRADPARRRERGGAGLGLEITRRIVEAHGGRMSVTSVVGQGSTFGIILPAVGD